MFLPFLLFAAQVAAQPSEPASPRVPPNASQSVPTSKPQAEAAVVANFNRLVAAMSDFSSAYKGSHTVDARKARAVRQAWRDFQAAQARYNEFIERQK